MRLLLASDLHYSQNLAAEIATNHHRLPADTYDHQVDGKLYWHNYMLVEQGERLCDGLARLVDEEKPDLLILLGDLVNTNWETNVAAVARRVAALPCPVRLVTGNHDIYLDAPGCRLQDALAPGDFAGGLRHEVLDGLGLIYLDLFAQESAQDAMGSYRKWIDPHAQERVDYRPADVAGALALLDAQPEIPWLVFGHFPMVAPDARIDAPGRKIGHSWPGGAALAARLHQPGNLRGILCGHQHFAHFQRFAHGFHWTLPALVESPCAAAVLEGSGDRLCGRTVVVDAGLAATSLHPRREAWTVGAAQDRQFCYEPGA
jgi:predicted phosphodiesterase